MVFFNVTYMYSINDYIWANLNFQKIVYQWYRFKFLSRPEIDKIIHIIDPYGLKRQGLHGITRD